MGVPKGQTSNTVPICSAHILDSNENRAAFIFEFSLRARLTWMGDLQFLNQVNVNACPNWPQSNVNKISKYEKSPGLKTLRLWYILRILDILQKNCTFFYVLILTFFWLDNILQLQSNKSVEMHQLGAPIVSSSLPNAHRLLQAGEIVKTIFHLPDTLCDCLIGFQTCTSGVN